jgi:hypothetical protein
MEELVEGSAETVDRVGEKEQRNTATVSARKLEANRKNCLKSTGPRTARGKAFSRRNALKHGFFARETIDFFLEREDPEEYDELLNGLREDFQPVGAAEELEVWNIAVRWRMFARLLHFESAQNRVAMRRAITNALGQQTKYCGRLEKIEKAAIYLLRSATKEIEDTGEISDELSQRMFRTMPELKAMWPTFEETAQEMLKLPTVSKIVRESSAKERASAFALSVTTIAKTFLAQLSTMRNTSAIETAIGQHLIPSGENLDRILRYNAMIDGSLSRSLDRLKLLQRRRKRGTDPSSRECTLDAMD